MHKIGQSSKELCSKCSLYKLFHASAFFPPCTHMISITQDKHKTSKLVALLMGREQKRSYVWCLQLKKQAQQRSLKKNIINSMNQLEKQISLLLKLSGSTIFGKLLELPCPRVTSYKQPALCNQEKKYDEPHVLPT